MMVRSRFDMENSVKRRRQQALLFATPGVSQQEEKQLQQELKAVKEKLALIGCVGVRCGGKW